jgi:hypothetical protein
MKKIILDEASSRLLEDEFEDFRDSFFRVHCPSENQITSKSFIFDFFEAGFKRGMSFEQQIQAVHKTRERLK